MALSAGTVISGYRIEAVLGSGGMGTVYRAAHPSLPRSDALKVLSTELSATPDFRTRFIREADLAATLDHPNIVTVYNRGETDEGQLWIAMQYVQGSDADKEVTGRGMDPARAAHIIGEVAKALDYAHRRKLLHRDVKPANFLLAPNDERVLLADFGIARAVDDATGLTATGVVMASVAYAAPESMAGLPVDHRADIYSLGCSLYRMLTGTMPFAGSGVWLRSPRRTCPNRRRGSPTGTRRCPRPSTTSSPRRWPRTPTSVIRAPASWPARPLSPSTPKDRK